MYETSQKVCTRIGMENLKMDYVNMKTALFIYRLLLNFTTMKEYSQTKGNLGFNLENWLSSSYHQAIMHNASEYSDENPTYTTKQGPLVMNWQVYKSYPYTWL